jgi:hypothetical protein
MSAQECDRNHHNKKNKPLVVDRLKTGAAQRQIDLHPDIAEYLRTYMTGKAELLFTTSRGTAYLPDNLEACWLIPRLIEMGLDTKHRGFHAFKRFRKTRLRGQRCLQDVNNFWMAHKPKTMSEIYSHLREELQLRLDEADRIGFG